MGTPSARYKMTTRGTLQPGITDLPSYNIRNGDPETETVVPNLLTYSIPATYHWVPIDGILPGEAMNHIEGFIKSHIYHLTVNRPPRFTDAEIRYYGIMLGVARAVMTADYGLERYHLNPNETAAPVLCVVDGVTASGTSTQSQGATYELLFPTQPVDHLSILTTPLVFTETEQMLIRVVTRSAHAIIPLQGYNLIVDNHHYLSDTSKLSNRSFRAVEKQVWVSDAWKDFFYSREDEVRDLMWHKAGHPVVVSVKELAASSEQVKTNLIQVKLGSAAARLPAFEPEVRAADTYLKMMQTVDSVWQTMGGFLDTSSISDRINVVKKIPRKSGDPEITPPLSIPGDPPVTVRNRKEALAELGRVLAANTELVAQCYGFYRAMMDAEANETGAVSRDTLTYAHSLRKLAGNSTASYAYGVELYEDYRAQKASNRAQGVRSCNIPNSSM